MAREQGYKLVFAASIAGGSFWLAVELIWPSVASTPLALAAQDWWYSRVPVQHSLPVVAAFALSIGSAWPLNFFTYSAGLSPERVQRWWVRLRGDPVEEFLRDSLENQDPVMVTLRSGKVYVGRVYSSVNPAHPVESVRLSLIRSGYRDSARNDLHFTVDYEDAPHSRIRGALLRSYESLVANLVKNRPAADALEVFQRVYGKPHDEELIYYEVVVPAKEIVSLMPFDSQVFDEHFQRA